MSPCIDPLHMTSYWASGGQIYNIYIAKFSNIGNVHKILKY